MNKHNYYMGTVCNWVSCEHPDREPDYVSCSGSAYWYTEEGVYRYSNHWGSGVASCDWYLGNYTDSSWLYDEGYQTGYTSWDGFSLKPWEVTVYGDKAEGLDGRRDETLEGVPFVTVKVTEEMLKNGRLLVGEHSCRFSHEDFMYID